MYNEFMVEFKDGTRDWVDPVESIREDDYMIYVRSAHGFIYEFSKADVNDWILRPYDPETTYEWIEK